MSDYYENAAQYSAYLADAEAKAKETGSTLFYDCISYGAAVDILRFIHGEGIPEAVLNSAWDNKLNIISYAAARGYEVKEIAGIGCSEHPGNGRAFLLKSIHPSQYHCDKCGGIHYRDYPEECPL